MEIDPTLLAFRNLAVALAVGLLIGLERGWQKRDADSGQRVAGLRTFAIIGVGGGVIGQLSVTMGPIVLGLGLIAIASILIAAHVLSSRASRDYGITSEIAAFTTFALAAMATTGSPAPAAAGAVVTATLLGLKPELHGWLERLDRDELIAALKLLMISVLVLPLMPDQGLGPWATLNPYRIWMLVVVVASISFAGHFAVRLLGQARGILTTGVFGGLASSTALTLHFARLSRRTRGLDALLAVGIILAQAMGMPRMIVVAAVASPVLARAAVVPLLVMMGVALISALLLHSRLDTSRLRAPRRLGPPFRLKDTLRFAVLLVAITLASATAHHLVGDAGVFAIAAIAAMGDLTAVTLSMAQLTQTGVPTDTAARALVVAAMSSVLFKSLLAYLLGGQRLGLLVASSATCVAMTGAVALLIMLDYWPLF
ncbi:MgtC/SapB family protein [Salinisphaera aquimarina]|uniref:MgtC/SapB family protein n=1 Tax=Salinisphaera aquimarina TaxID=2094031 RepID=A0ABV7EKD6_9GAMM